MSLIVNKTCTFPIYSTTVDDDNEERKPKECGKPAVRRFLLPHKTAWACREHEREYELTQIVFDTWVNFDEDEKD